MGKKRILYGLLLVVLFLNSSFVYGSVEKEIYISQTNQFASKNQSINETEKLILDNYEPKLACKQDLSVDSESLTSIRNLHGSLIDGNTTQSDQNKDETQTNEILSERTEHSKTFQVSENIHKLVSTVESQHYINDGKWQDINTSFKLDEQSQIVMDENRFCVTINNDSHSINLAMADSTIDYIPVSANEAKVIVDLNQVSFIDLWKDTDLVYTVHNDVLEMKINLKSSNTPSQLKLKLGMHNLRAKVDQFDNILLINQNEQTLMALPKMNKQETLEGSQIENEFSYYLTTEDTESYLVFNVNQSEQQVYPLSIGSVITEVEGYSSNKLFHDLPNVSTDKIQSITFQNESSNGDWDWNPFDRPMNVYFMREEVRDFGCNYGRGCSPHLEPGSDGRSVAWLGSTTSYDGFFNSITFYQPEILQLVGTIDIYGAMFYHESDLDEPTDHITTIEMVYEEIPPVPQNNIQYFYDANNRLNYILMDNGKRINYFYDQNGNLEGKTIINNP
ncbi:hypothetical protein [Paenibacillus sinopodophylli]|uniref:hypothetical protein n=1 Tax=Paenibacillus sinopodophylli TaxID=1837342 RepID=UPI00110CF934|nr:hypothetical protein [Paenibacillus sinopodophylli]